MIHTTITRKHKNLQTNSLRISTIVVPPEKPTFGQFM